MDRPDGLGIVEVKFYGEYQDGECYAVARVGSYLPGVDRLRRAVSDFAVLGTAGGQELSMLDRSQMSDWFEWRGENFYAVRGADLFFVGSAVKRAGAERWDARVAGVLEGVFISEAAARRRVELVASGRFPMRRLDGRSSLAGRTTGSTRGGARDPGQEPRRRW